MAEIRRIADGEGEMAAALWDEQARTAVDGGPLSERGRRNIARMLDITAWHERQLCLVAVDDARIVGFVCASVGVGTGLLPGLTSEIDVLYVRSEARGKGTSQALAQAFWQMQGFERDMVCLSLYGSR